MKECYRWRETVMKEIGDKVAEIQNAGLGDYRIRTLNDEINKLINHKRMWEKRIRELGGPDFGKEEARFYDKEGVELPGSGGYMYFGAAKDLPGVRELFYREINPPPEKNFKQIYENLDYSYFDMDLEDFNDDVAFEEDLFVKENVQNWVVENNGVILQKYPKFFDFEEEQIYHILENDIFEEITEERENEKNITETNKILETKKRELISQYVENQI
jgi:pre-mRNA-splicing factor ISY1